MAYPVKWQQCLLLLLSLMFFFNLAPSFHLPPTFAQLLRELTCCGKRWNDIFEQIWGEWAQGGWCIAALDHNRKFFDDDRPFTVTVQQGQSKEWRKHHWHLNLIQYSLPSFLDTVCLNERIRMLKHRGKTLWISNLWQSRSSLHTSVHLLLSSESTWISFLTWWRWLLYPADGQEVQS